MKVQNKEYAIRIADQILVDFAHAIPAGGDLLELHQSSPRFAAALISTWGEKYKATGMVPPPLVLQVCPLLKIFFACIYGSSGHYNLA